MIDPRKFSKPCMAEGQDKFLRFGGEDKAVMAAELRLFADAIENGEILITKVQTGSVSEPSEWLAHAIMLEYVEREVAQ